MQPRIVAAFSPFSQGDGVFALVHELTAIHYQPPARSPDARIALAGVVPAIEMAGREEQ